MRKYYDVPTALFTFKDEMQLAIWNFEEFSAVNNHRINAN